MSHSARISNSVRGDVFWLLLAAAVSGCMLIFGLSIIFDFSLLAPRQDAMADLLCGRAHPPLVEVDLERELSGPKGKRKEILKIDDPSTIRHIDNHSFHTDRFRDEYIVGSLQPFKAAFVLGDGSRYNGVIEVPNKPGFLRITYPINPYSFDVLDDKVYVLDLDPEKTKSLYELFKRLGAYP